MTAAPAPGSYAVIGLPSRSSLSPPIHAAFDAQLNIGLTYGIIEPDDGGFERAARAFFSAGGRGLNITAPFKERALKLAAEATPAAKLAGSANTLRADGDGSVAACTTDGPGLLADLIARRKWQLADARIVILGAGGAAASVLGTLLDRLAGELLIANRNPQRAEQLHERFAGQAGIERLATAGTDSLADVQADCVINSTSAGFAGKAPAGASEALRGARYACDLSYGAAAEPFLALADEAGVPEYCDGLGMLIEQAALSHAYWHRSKPDTAPVHALLASRGRQRVRADAAS